MNVTFATGLAVLALVGSITSVSAQPLPDTHVGSIDWPLVRAAQDAYDRVRDADDYDARDKAYQALYAVADSQGLSIPQFDGKLRGPRLVFGIMDNRLDIMVTGQEIPLGASCGLSLEIPCVTGDLARARREEEAAKGVLLDTWEAEELPTAIYERV
jgi:hypothetical protein